jgi:hypothetical protein
MRQKSYQLVLSNDKATFDRGGCLWNRFLRGFVLVPVSAHSGSVRAQGVSGPARD